MQSTSKHMAHKAAEPIALLEHVSFHYPGTTVPILQNVDLRLLPGEIVSLIGPSGAGKTTLLKLLSGELEPDRGSVRRSGEVALVAQDYTLFPHLDAMGNVELVLRRREGLSRLFPDTTIQEKARNLLTRVGLAGFEHHKPAQLSGGQRQRVAIAQALAQKASLLLMDEPFGALDLHTREQMQLLLIDMARQSGMSIVLVTHDLEEALFCSDRIFYIPPHHQVVKMVEEYVVLGNVERIPALKSSEPFLKRLALLRNTLARTSEEERPSGRILDRGLITEADMMVLESRARRIIVISRELFQERHNRTIQETVRKNWASGKEYVYVLPADAHDARYFIEREAKGLENVQLIIREKDDCRVFLLGEIVIYIFDGNEPPRGYSYFGEVGATTLVRIPEQMLKSLLEILLDSEAWISE